VRGARADTNASGQAQNAVPSHAPDAPAAKTAARPRPDEIPPAARTGTDYLIKYCRQQRQGANMGRSMPAASGPPREHHVHSSLGRALSALKVTDLGRRGKSRVVSALHPGPVVAETD
jgi:hypothetical protein